MTLTPEKRPLNHENVWQKEKVTFERVISINQRIKVHKHKSLLEKMA